jgi:hypothetical protein
LSCRQLDARYLLYCRAKQMFGRALSRQELFTKGAYDMLIQNYGLFWRRADVFWGRQRVSGHLRGYPARAKFSLVDFRGQQGVYCLYDENFRIVYIGQAGANEQRLFNRLRQHRTDALAQRWTRFSWFGIRWIKSGGKLASPARGAHTTVGAVLNHIEAILISAVEPPHNRQGGRFGDEVMQYLQWRDADQLGPTPDEMLRDVWRIRNSV